jgi:DNA repair protein RecN (Recombination protein N)
VIDAQGRSRAYINGSAATVTQLREVGEQLVDIHGQHAHQSLAASRQPTRYAGRAWRSSDASATTSTNAWKAWRKVERQLSLSEQDASVIAAAREKLEWQTAELDRLSLGPTEWQDISI